jgi:hypothetical protein
MDRIVSSTTVRYCTEQDCDRGELIIQGEAQLQFCSSVEQVGLRNMPLSLSK